MNLSLVVPVFAEPRLVHILLESICNQVCLPREVVIVDDRYSRETTDFLQRFCQQSPFVTKLIVNESNLGVTKSTRRGLDICTSEFVGFVDSDDYLLPQATSNFMTVIGNNPDLDIYSSNFAYFHNSIFESTAESLYPRNRSPLLIDLSLEKAQIFDNILTHFKVIRRELLSQLDFDSSWDGVQDQIINWSIAKGRKIVIDDDVTYLHRVHEKQQTNAAKLSSLTNMALNEARREYVKETLGINRSFLLTQEVRGEIGRLSWLIRSEIESACEGEFISLDLILSRLDEQTISQSPDLRKLDIQILKVPQETTMWRINLLEMLSNPTKFVGVYLNSGNEGNWSFALNYSGLFDFVMIDNPLVQPVLKPQIPKGIEILF